MPSQLAHLVFAVEAIKNAFDRLPVPLDSPFLAFGAQGPDVFYHNRRRKPSGLEYGALLHRRGYGTAVAALVAYGRERNIPFDSDYGAYVAGFATHALFDRIAHPFVNYFAGWGVGEQSNAAEALPFQLHAYLERVLDALLLQRYWRQRADAFDFLAAFDCGPQLPLPVAEGLARALTSVTDRAARDNSLLIRLHNVYLDSLSFYGNTNLVDVSRMRMMMDHVRSPEQLARWLSLLHPIEPPTELDPANERNARWFHPCDANEVRYESFWDLFAQAIRRSPDMLQAVASCWRDEISAGELATIVGNQNLSDGSHEGRPCRKRHSSPLPLAQHLNTLLQQLLQREADCQTPG